MEDHPSYSVVSNHLETMSGHVEGVPQPQVLGTRSNMSWDDPPSRAQLGGVWNWRNPDRHSTVGWMDGSNGCQTKIHVSMYPLSQMLQVWNIYFGSNLWCEVIPYMEHLGKLT